MLNPCFCHICHGEIREDQNGIEHSGHGQLTQSRDPRLAQLHDLVEGYVTVWFHPECATVMALRLAADVMKIKTESTQPKRVVDELKDLAKLNQFR
jgi:hypothetical protein